MLRRELPNGYALRLFEEADADELYALIDANREYLATWLPWAPHHTGVETVLPFIRLTRKQIGDNNGLQTAIVDPDGRIAGAVGFHNVDWLNGTSSIGYWLARGEQGRGTMTEAVRALVNHAFATWKLNRIVIQAAVENAPSRTIPERLGFREEGTLREVERVGDRVLDTVLYSMLAADWPGAG